MNKSRYRIAGWISVVMAFLCLPLFLLALLSGILQKQHPEIYIITIVVELILTGLDIYVIIVIKKLLNEYAKFYYLDKVINCLVIVSILFLFLPIFRITNSFTPYTRLVIDSGFIFINGLLQLIFGIKLIKCDNNLFNYKIIFSYLSIVVGVLMMTVVLSPIALLVAIAYSIYTAKIFFSAARKT